MLKILDSHNRRHFRRHFWCKRFLFKILMGKNAITVPRNHGISEDCIQMKKKLKIKRLPFSASFPAPLVRRRRLCFNSEHSCRNEKNLGYPPLSYYGIKPAIFTKNAKIIKKLTSGATFGAVFEPIAPVEHLKSTSQATPEIDMTSSSLRVAFSPSI